MSVLSWNCRGLGNPQTIQVLRDLVNMKRPNFFFLVETFVGRSVMERVGRHVGFGRSFVVERSGHGGGIAMFWKDSVSARLLSYSNNHIDFAVKVDDLGEWRLTGFYGFPERRRRNESWNFIRSLSRASDLPWCVIGDFNDLLSHYEKRGNIEHPNWLLTGFRGAIEDSNLFDLGMVGYDFTWERGRGTDHWGEERLDRALATQN